MCYAHDVKLQVDAQGLECPFPVIKAKRAIQRIEIGEIMEVCTSDPLSPLDVRAWIRSAGHELVYADDATPPFRFLIRRIS